MKAKKMFTKLSAKTHMPFVSDGTILFCMSDRLAKRPGRSGVREDELLSGNRTGQFRPWDLACTTMARPKILAVKTGLPEDSVICSPAFYRDNDLIHVSFIAGVPKDGSVRYNLYTMSGPSFDQMSEAEIVGEQSARLGFVSPNYFCLGGRDKLTLLDRNTKRQLKLTTSLRRIQRVTFDASNPDRLVITGIDDWGDRITIVHDMTSGKTQEIRVDGPIYKSCLDGERVVFARSESDEIEDYHLHIAEYELVETSESVTIQSL